MSKEWRCCQNCKFGGCDPDGPYCAHPKALEKSGGFGLSLSSKTSAEMCPYPQLPLFERKDR